MGRLLSRRATSVQLRPRIAVAGSREQSVGGMLSGLPIMMLVAAQAAATAPVREPPPATPIEEAAGYGPALPPPPKPKVKAPSEPCKTPDAKDVKEETTEIVVCAQ